MLILFTFMVRIAGSMLPASWNSRWGWIDHLFDRWQISGVRPCAGNCGT